MVAGVCLLRTLQLSLMIIADFQVPETPTSCGLVDLLTGL